MLGRGITKSPFGRSPGPGEYQYDSLNSKGLYPLSTSKNSSCVSWGASKIKRFNYQGN